MKNRGSALSRVLSLLVCGILLAASVLGAGQPAGAQEITPPSGSTSPGETYAPDQLLLRFRPGVSRQRADEILEQRGLSRLRRIEALSVEVLRLPRGLTVERAVAIYSRHPQVEFAEPNYVLQALEITDQWGLEKVRAEQAWPVLGSDPPPVLLATVDTGIDRNHPDLSANIWTNPDDPAGNGDDDNNGYVDDTWGWDFVNNDNDPMDDMMHGTAVSSVAAGVADGSGVVGVCPWCQLMSVKVLDALGSGYLDTVAQGVTYAVDNGAQVINLSLGATAGAATLEQAVTYAWEEGALVVAAAGNNGLEQLFYPAAYAHAMAVGSTNEDDYRSCFSNYSDGFITVTAPGEAIVAAMPNQSYGTHSGTSLAAPHVTGLAGLLFSQDPARTNDQVWTLIEQTAVDLGPVGTDGYFGAGRIDAYRAVLSDTQHIDPPQDLYTEDPQATGYAHARKLARDGSGNLHWVWHTQEGGQYQVLYASSEDGGQTWTNPPEVVFSSSYETFHPALAVDGGHVYIAFPSKYGSTIYKTFFTSKDLNDPDGGTWSTPAPVLGGTYHAVRPDLHVDADTDKIHLVASSYDDAPYVYHAWSDDFGATWHTSSPVPVGFDSSRYADVYAYGDEITIAARILEFYWIIIIPVPRYHLRTFHSTDGGETWQNSNDLALHDALMSDEYGFSLTGVEHDLSLAYEHAGNIHFGSSSDGLNWALSPNDPLGTGKWPTLAQASDGQAWAMWDRSSSIVMRHYTGSAWEPEEALGTGTYPNLKAGISRNRLEWVVTRCSAPYCMSYGSRSLVDPELPVVTILSPAEGSDIAGNVPIRVNATDAKDPAGTLTVEWNVDGGAWQPTTYNGISGHYEASWDTASDADGPHTLNARTTDSDSNSGSDSANVTVDNTPPAVSITSPSDGALLSGIINITATASDANGVTQVEFFADDTSIGVDTAAPYEASWTPSSEGAYTITATATDAAGHTTTSASVSITVDNTLPAVSITSPSDGAFLSGSIDITATASDAHVVAQVEFFADGTSIGVDTQAPYEASWTPSSEGAYTITATATDSASNSDSDSVSITVDNTSPAVSITSPGDDALVSGIVNITATASDANGVTQVEFFADDTSIGVDTAAPYEASWTPSSEGAYTITATASDAAGHTTTSASVSITVDNTLPAVSITSPSDGALLSGIINITATASDANGVTQVEFFADDTSIGVDTAAPYEASWTPSSEGAYTITATASDAAGHTTTSDSVGVTVDNTLPAVSITSPSDGAFLSGSIDITASASDANGVTEVEFFADGTSIGVDTAAPYEASWTPSSEGVYTITATATDTAGHTASDSVSITVDNTPPAVSITSPGDDALVSGIVNITADASDANGVAQVEFFVDGTSIGVDTAAPYEASWTPSSEGLHPITATATDAAGHTTTSASVRVTVDNTPPAVGITNPSDGAPVSGLIYITANASDAHGVTRVEFFIDDTSIAIDTYGSNGWSTGWDTADFADGPYTVRATATDGARISGSDSVSVTVDNTPPAVSITSPGDGAAVSGIIDITASASDANGVIRVEFFVDGGSIGVDTEAPYAAVWDSATAINGYHTISATATDSASNSRGDSVGVTVNNALDANVHVGDLDGIQASTAKRFWWAEVTITVHDQGENPVPNATVSGTWSGVASGSGFCVTGSDGTCPLLSPKIPLDQTIRFTVDNVTHATLPYYGENHDLDGDSDGTTLILSRSGSLTPPTVTITQPADGATFASGATINFAGTASDAEEIDLTASLVWTSDLEGWIGTGGSFSADLSDGVHTIIATVTDSKGARGSHTISITVGTLPVAMHVGGLDGDSVGQPSGRWNATVHILVHDADGAELAGATVSGMWEGGANGSCTTVAKGRCTITLENISKKASSVFFAVTGITRPGYTYKEASNNQTVIEILKPN